MRVCFNTVGLCTEKIDLLLQINYVFAGIMYIINFFILLLPFVIAKQVNQTLIDKYRKDFIGQMLNGIPIRFPTSNKRLQNKPVEDEAIMYYLYNQKYPVESIVINNNLTLVDAKLPVKLLVHGWTEHYYVEWCKNMTAAYLRKGRYNVIVLDWSSKGDADYMSASLAVPSVSSQIGDFIVNRLYREKKISLTKIHLISHSLGCHVAGLTGQRVYEISKKKLGRITALDPAAPYFDLFTIGPNDRLSADDAIFVDIVHTDGGWLGFRASLGTVDFFPNGGTAVQPGCSLLKPDVQYEDLFCSHARSHKFYTKSILNDSMMANSCPNWRSYDKGDCISTTEVRFGDESPTNITGSFFLRTDL